MSGSIGAIPIIALGAAPSAAVTKYRFVKMTGEQICAMASAEGEECHGVAQEAATTADVTDGKVIGIQFEGFAICEAAEAVTIMQDVMCSANGRVMAAKNGCYVMGRAWTTAANGGDLMVVQLMPSGLGRADYVAPTGLTAGIGYTASDTQACIDKIAAIIAALIAAGLMDAS
jgi:hypothetical protein